MIAIAGVQTAAIVDEHGSTLAHSFRPSIPQNRFATWFTSTYLGLAIEDRRDLLIALDDEIHHVGVLSVGLVPHYVAEGLLSLAATAVIASFVEALLIGLVILLISSRLVAAPLRRVARSIAEVNPDRADALALPIPVEHEKDELGHLLRRTNQLLSRLANTQEELRNIATRDALTDLPNRSLIAQSLEQAIVRSQRNDSLLAVLFLDLDSFKYVNDSLGHDVGDDLLVAISDELMRTVRANDSVGRLGGDEFLILLEGLSRVEQAIQTVRRITLALSRPFILSGHEVSLRPPIYKQALRPP